jgi:NAD(P)-dependent dehydrogenase (short-subunit alcohol dehydrogenase family)
MKTVLITGCSSGYGRATAKFFHEQGWNVIATMRTPSTALEESDRLRLVPLDVTDARSVTAAIERAIALFGGLDVVVNNAGIGLFSAFEATPAQMIRDVFETNVFGVMAVTCAVIPHFRERGAGTVINVTSSVGILPMPFVAPYTASKWAIEGFTESLGYELSCFGARAKIVEPGYGPTTAFSANSHERMTGLLPAPYTAYANQLLCGMAGAKTTNELDVARAVWLAATDDSERLRYAAGPDAEDLAAMRRALPGEAYLAQARAAMGPKV